jgi:hypothetical protein
VAPQSVVCEYYSEFGWGNKLTLFIPVTLCIGLRWNIGIVLERSKLSFHDVTKWNLKARNNLNSQKTTACALQNKLILRYLVLSRSQFFWYLTPCGFQRFERIVVTLSDFFSCFPPPP